MPRSRRLAHPFICSPILYIANPPEHLKWAHVQATFKGRGCGTIEDMGAGPVEGRSGQRRWGIRFLDVFHAEIAFATMQRAVVAGLSPPWTMTLSHLPTLATDTSYVPIFPQYLQAEAGFYKDKTPHLLFRFFRNAGPLISVRMNVDIGNKRRAAVVEFCMEEHANTARTLKNGLHKLLPNRSVFSLRTFDSCTLRCTGFEHFFPQKGLLDAFSKFGTIVSASVYFGQNGTFGVVTFDSPDSAAHALQEMDGKTLGGSLIAVSYEEPAAQDVFRRPSPTRTCHADKSGNVAPDIPQSPSSIERKRRDALAREMKENAERQAKETSAREAAEAKVKKRKQQVLRKEQAAQAHFKAKKALDAAMEGRRNACKDVVQAKQEKEKAAKELSDARSACAKAKRIWEKAMNREAQATRQMATAEKATSDAERRRESASAKMATARQEEKALRLESEKLASELGEDALDEETLRLAELAESIRRMEELRKLDREEKEERARREEEAVREKERLDTQAAEEKVRKEKQAAEERLRREREEAERLVREKREREEQAKRDEEARKRCYEQAFRSEQIRCRLRDLQFCRTSTLASWNGQRAFERFKFVSEEFDAIKFLESQPLTFESVPWPILAHPRAMDLNAIEWGAVEEFFKAMEPLLQDKAEYRAFVEKAHRRFHPDKWRARGILNSILDDTLRGQLEAAGNVVAQAITPLWLKSRQ